MHILFSNLMKKTFVVSAFIMASSSLAMENDDIYLGQTESTSKVDKTRTSQFLDNTKNMFSDGFAKVTDFYSTWRNDQKSSEKVESVAENHVVPAQKEQEIKVKVTWLTKKNALKFGIGAVALVTIGYGTYVLYENGTLKKVADAMKQHPYISAGSVTGVVALVGSLLVYKYYHYKPVHI